MQSTVTSICILFITGLGIWYGGSVNPQNLQLERKIAGNTETPLNTVEEPGFPSKTPCNINIVSKIPMSDKLHSDTTRDRAEEHNSKTEWNPNCEMEMQILKIKELVKRLDETEKLLWRIDDFEKRLREAELKISNIDELEQRNKESFIQTSRLGYKRKRILTNIRISEPKYPTPWVKKPNLGTLQRKFEGARTNFKNIVLNEGKYNSKPINKTMIQISNVDESEKVYGKMFQQKSRQGEILVNLKGNFSKTNTQKERITKPENESFKIKVFSDDIIDHKSMVHRSNESNGHKYRHERYNANKKIGTEQKEYHGLIEKELRFSRIKRSNVQGTLNIAFSAHMDGWVELHLADVETLPFTAVSLNDGNAYDAHLKTFTCPVNGIYFFTATIVSQDHKFEAAIVLNGDSVAVITTGEGSGYRQGSNSITVHCNQGQRVWIRVNNNFGIGKKDDIFSIFTGFLVHSLAESSSN